MASMASEKARCVHTPLARSLSAPRKALSNSMSEVKSYYKRVLEGPPDTIAGWTLEPGDMRRAINDPVGALERLIEQSSVQEFLACCAPSVPSLEKAWAKKIVYHPLKPGSNSVIYEIFSSC
jgi:hypothetical protein